jgi:predicted ATPase
MLKKIKIKGFKSIVDVEIELGTVNLFIGANGSGKSNILEAIGVLSCGLSRDMSEAELQRKGVRLSVPTLFKSAFKKRKLRVNFNLEAELEHHVEYKMALTASESNSGLRFSSEAIKQGKKSYLGRSNRGIRIAGQKNLKEDIALEQGLWDRFREIRDDFPAELSDELNTLAKFCIYAPQTSFLRGIDVENAPVQPLGLCGGNLAQAAGNIFSNINELKDINAMLLSISIANLVWLPKWANEIQAAPFNASTVSSQVKKTGDILYFKDKFMKKGRDSLSAYDSSEGTLYLLFLVTLILHYETPKIFALDNIDNALNPKATRALLEKLIEVCCNDAFAVLENRPQQVFLTSHNPSALDAFDLFDDRQKIFVVSRNEDGHTQIDPLTVQKGISRAEWVRIKKGKNLSEMWLDGLIPNALDSNQV